MDGKFVIDNSEWEYFIYGNGERTMVALHGYGNDAGDFRIFSRHLPGYRLIALNLLFHGNSTAGEKMVSEGMTADQLKRLLDNILLLTGAQKCSMMGFSLGGRIALKLLEIYPERIDEFVLMASDGLKINPFYRLVTGTAAGKSLFRKIVKDPSGYLNLARALEKSGLLNEKKYHFAMRNFDTARKRDKLYLVWMSFRKFTPDIRRIAKHINRFRIRGYVISGKFDTIIPPSNASGLMKGVDEKLVTHHVIDVGHWMLREEVAEKVGRLMNG